MAKIKAKLDSTNFRYELSPLVDGTLRLDKALRSIMNTTNTKWKELAQFTGLDSTNAIFRATYGSPSSHVAKLRDVVRKLFVINAEEDKAFLYHKDHAPVQVEPSYVGPTLLINEPASQSSMQYIPVSFAARSSIEAKGVLILTLTPTGGYIYDARTDKLANINAPVVFVGTAFELTKVLARVKFVGTSIGAGKVVVTVDDNNDKDGSVVSGTIKIAVSKNTEVVSLGINLPTSSALKLNEYTTVTGLSVTEQNNRVIACRVTPFNCSLMINSQLEPIADRTLLTITGTPDAVTAKLASFKILATDKTAQLGIQVICGNQKLLKYYAFEYETVEEEEVPVTTFEADNILAPANSVAELSAMFSNDVVTTVVSATVLPTNCSVVYDGTTHASSFTVTGTVEAVNELLAEATVNVGDANGTIAFTYDGETKTITVTSEPVETALEENNAQL